VVDWKDDQDRPGRPAKRRKSDRPGFEAALEAVERGEADGLAVAKLTRFARSVSGAAKALERLEAAGGSLLAADLNLDTSTPSGKLMRNVLFSLAEFELDVIAENWEAATDAALARGAYIGPTPTGYRRRADGTLEPDDPDDDQPDAKGAAIVREVFKRRASGDNWATLARYMTGEGLETPFGNPHWTIQTVKRIVGNVAYLGTVRQGDRVRHGAHEPLVTRQVWEAAQLPRRTASAKTSDGLLLTGLVRCANCRYRMKGHKTTGSYQCESSRAAQRCPHPTSIRAAKLDDFVLGVFWRQFEATTVAEPVEATEEVDVAVAAVEAAEHELDVYLQTAVVDIVGVEAFRRAAEVRTQALDEARTQLADAQNSLRSATLSLPLDLRDAWEEMTLGERRQILRGAIDAVVVWPSSGRGKRDPASSRVRVVWRGDAPTELPGAGRVAYTLSSWPGPRPSSDTEPAIRVARA
jgi:DNA invertase Pin-like site-specific DNA recombinase